VLETIAIILIVLWLLGMVSGYTLGLVVYGVLVIAVVLFLPQGATPWLAAPFGRGPR